MTFAESIQTCFNKYTTIKGRASRSEYWYWILFCMLVYLGLSIFGFLSYFIGITPITLMFFAVLVLFGPSFCVTIRRLHDTGKSGWWYWVGAIPLVGIVWLIVLLCGPSQEDENEYDLPSLNQQEPEPMAVEQ